MFRIPLRVVSATVVFCTAALAASAHAATVSVAYWPNDPSFASAWIADWSAKNHRAHVVNLLVQADGSYTDDGTQRVVTFDGAGMPTYVIDAIDCNGDLMQQRVEITQNVHRTVGGKFGKGTAQVVEIGYTTDLGGCTPGKRTDFGSVDDPGIDVNDIDMAHRPSMGDLTPGTRLAGPSESPEMIGLAYVYTVQFTTLGSNSITFEATGDTLPMSRVDGWLVIDLGATRRAYTRLSHDDKTGLEQWLISDHWKNGKPGPIENTTLVVPNAAAGFGKNADAAHVWNQGLFMQSDIVTRYDLYKDHSGVRVTNDDIVDGLPLTWALDKGNLVTKRPTQDTYHKRTWVPVANTAKYHYVLESEDLYDMNDQFLAQLIPPRVDWYVDEGKAVRP